MLNQLGPILALGLTAFVVGLGLGAMSMVRIRPRKVWRGLPKADVDIDTILAQAERPYFKEAVKP